MQKLNLISDNFNEAAADITITPAAINAARGAVEASEGLRIAVVGGGCSGYNYSLGVDDDIDEEDIILNYDGLQVYIDPHSYSLLKGTVVDYTVSFEKSGFSFTNPNAKKTCGCGSSFSV